MYTYIKKTYGFEYFNFKMFILSLVYEYHYAATISLLRPIKVPMLQRINLCGALCFSPFCGLYIYLLICGRESRYFYHMSQKVSVFKISFHRHKQKIIRVTPLEYFLLNESQHCPYVTWRLLEVICNEIG